MSHKNNQNFGLYFSILGNFLKDVEVSVKDKKSKYQYFIATDILALHYKSARSYPAGFSLQSSLFYSRHC
jgi:hypothetical protein